MRFLFMALVLTGCTLYFDDRDRPSPEPDDGPIVVPTDGGPALRSCSDTVTCAPGDHCEAQCAPAGARGCTEPCHSACVPDVRCEDVDCGPGASCVESCLHDCSGFPWLCDQACVPHANPGTCATASCRQEAPACPAGTKPGVENGCYNGFCIPSTACGTTDPGSCNAATVTCESLPPACPEGTTPGVDGDCWSGFCLPASACTCGALGTQETCEARSDCFAIVGGIDCDCHLEVCNCQSTAGAFERCQSRM